MQKDDGSILIITTENLSSLEKVQLVDLLQHETQLLVTATLAKVSDKGYIQSQRRRVENIQAEIKSRVE